jgi:hypothetical protein
MIIDELRSKLSSGLFMKESGRGCNSSVEKFNFVIAAIIQLSENLDMNKCKLILAKVWNFCCSL